MGAPRGNKNALGRQKPWSDALKEVLATYEDDTVEKGQALRTIGRKLVKQALEGDLPSIKEMGDRLDGRAHQSLSGIDDQPIELGINVTFGRN